MAVVCEGAAQAEATHDCEGEFIYQAGAAGVSGLVANPRLVLVGISRIDEATIGFEIAAQIDGILPEPRTGERIAALSEYKRGGDEHRSLGGQGCKCHYCGIVPLIPPVPDGNQADCVQKHLVHGWCSLCRSAVS